MSPERPPEPADDAAAYPRPPGWYGALLAANPEQARRWMRWAWVGGLLWSVWLTWWAIIGIVSVVAFAPPEGSGANALPVRPLIYAGVEALIIGGLAMGVMSRSRPAALALATGFLATRLALIAMGLITVSDTRDVMWLAIYLLLLFLFVRGAQGAWSYHWFTHPRHPV